MFIVVRAFCCLVICYAEANAASRILLHPFETGINILSRRTLTTIPSNSSVGIMGIDAAYTNMSPHNTEMRGSLTMCRPSVRKVLMFDEKTLSPHPVPEFQHTDKFAIEYLKSIPPRIKYIKPYEGDSDFLLLCLDHYRTHTTTDLKKHVDMVDRVQSAELFDCCILDSAEQLQACITLFQNQLPNTNFIKNFSGLKIMPSFDDNDIALFTNLAIPKIPDISEICSNKDILRLAKFYKDYANCIGYHFFATQKQMSHLVHVHRSSFNGEPSRLLHLVRPDRTMNKVYERAQRFTQYAKLEKVSHNYDDDLLRSFGKQDFAFTYSLIEKYWDVWFSENHDLVKACSIFSEMIWNRPLPHDLRAYATDQEFEYDLCEVDPEFKSVLNNRS